MALLMMPKLKKIARYKNAHWLMIVSSLLLFAGFVSTIVMIRWPSALSVAGLGVLGLWLHRYRQSPFASVGKSPLGFCVRNYGQMVENSAIGLANISLDGRFLTANNYLQTLLGYSEAELTQRTLQSLKNPEEIDDGYCSCGKKIKKQFEYPCFAVTLLQHKAGHYIWVKVTYSLVCRKFPLPQYLMLTIQDISDLKHTETLLKQSEQRFRTIMESISEEVCVWMATPGFGEIQYVNEGYERIWGCARNSLYQNPRSFLEQIHPEDRDRVLANFEVHELGCWSLDYRIVRRDGEVRYLHEVDTGIYEDGRLLYVVGTAIDRTSLIERQNLLDNSLQRLKEAYAHLEDSARRDGLTGILNRSAILNCIERAHENFSRYGTPATLVFIDLNRFKEVNDSHGHIVGDQTLIALAKHLKRNIRQTDDISRYGGDEFVVLLNNASKKQAEEFCRRVGQEVSLSLPEQRVIQASMSFGISELTTEIRDCEQWISEADLLMYGDKAQIQ